MCNFFKAIYLQKAEMEMCIFKVRLKHNQTQKIYLAMYSKFPLVLLRFEQWERGSPLGDLGICPDVTPAVSKPNLCCPSGADSKTSIYLSDVT